MDFLRWWETVRFFVANKRKKCLMADLCMQNGFFFFILALFFAVLDCLSHQSFSDRNEKNLNRNWLRKESDIRMKLAKKHTKEIDGGWMKMICRVCKAHTLRHNHENWKYFVLFVIVVVALHLRLGFAFSSIDNALIEINGQWLNANVQTACHICWHTMYLFTHVSQR